MSNNNRSTDDWSGPAETVGSKIDYARYKALQLELSKSIAAGFISEPERSGLSYRFERSFLEAQDTLR